MSDNNGSTGSTGLSNWAGDSGNISSDTLADYMNSGGEPGGGVKK